MNTFYPIDYYKSIKKQRIVYRMSIGLVWSYIVCYFNAIALFILISAFLNDLSQLTIVHNSPILLLLLVIIVPVFIIINLILLNKTVSTVGIDPKSNRADMITVLTKYYKLNNLDNTDDKITRDIRVYKTYRTGRAITCLFDQDTVYLNITIINVYNTFSPFNCLYLHYKCKRILKRFENLQAGRQIV